VERVACRPMRRLHFSRYALIICVAVAMLAGCGGSQPIDVPAPSRYGALPKPTVHNKTFAFTGKAQSFTVPAGVQSITVVMRGASGVPECSGDYAGRGARVFAVIAVTPHQKLWVDVGGQGNGSSGGFNRGGNGGDPPSFGNPSSGGGGASDVRVAPGRGSDRILVAGGGGGYGVPFGNTNHSDWGCPGHGGGLVGGDGLGGETYYGAGGGGCMSGSRGFPSRHSAEVAKRSGAHDCRSDGFEYIARLEVAMRSARTAQAALGRLFSQLLRQGSRSAAWRRDRGPWSLFRSPPADFDGTEGAKPNVASLDPFIFKGNTV